MVVADVANLRYNESMGKLNKKILQEAKDSAQEAGARIEKPDSTLKAPQRPVEAPSQGAYWKGRDFTPKPGSRRARAQPLRSKSNAPADLRPRKLMGMEVVERPVTDNILTNVQQLQEFEEFKKSILPVTLADVQSGMTAPEILQKYQALAAARMASLLVDPRQAYAASKEIMDRTMGKAVERKVVKHQYEDMSEQELDALILAQIKEVTGDKK